MKKRFNINPICLPFLFLSILLIGCLSQNGKTNNNRNAGQNKVQNKFKFEYDICWEVEDAMKA